MESLFDIDLKIKRIRRNSYYTGLLQNLFAGSESATNSVLQYSYNANILAPFYPEISNEFYEMVFDEIKVHYILSQLILLTGGDPVYSNAQGKWLGGRSVDYVKDIKQLIMLSVENMEKLIIDYKTVQSKIDDTEIKKYLTQILEIENNNRIKLLKLKKKYL